MKKSELNAMIRESVKKALLEYDETPEAKKARLAGRRKAIEKYGNASIEELSKALLAAEKQASKPEVYNDHDKSNFLDGAIVWITAQIRKLGGKPPRPGSSDTNPWA